MAVGEKFPGLKKIEINVSLDEGGDFYLLIEDSCHLMGVGVKRVARDLRNIVEILESFYGK
jgi:hypothetical protein